MNKHQLITFGEFKSREDVERNHVKVSEVLSTAANTLEASNGLNKQDLPSNEQQKISSRNEVLKQTENPIFFKTFEKDDLKE